MSKSLDGARESAPDFDQRGDTSRLVDLANRPLALMARYAAAHGVCHTVVLLSVLAAVACSVFSQYAVKNLVDVLSRGPHDPGVWVAFGLLAALIAADNMSWRAGGWAATHCFVSVSGDLRRDLFRHLTGHSPSYFAVRSPGTLAGRITATGNAIYTVENTLAWNVLPPCLAVLLSIGMLAAVDMLMAGVLVVMSVTLAWLLTRMAARGRSLHQSYAESAASVDGELVDVINNMPLVRAFGATWRERERFSEQVGREQQARGDSLRYLEKLRLFHAVTTAFLTAGLLGWAIMLWQRGSASTGDVVLVTTLGFTILHGTRDLAVALVDVIQHVARLSEALSTLLTPHELADPPAARTLRPMGGTVRFDHVSYAYPDGRSVLQDFNLEIEPGQRIGLVGRSGAGKSTVLALVQRLRDPQDGAISIDGEDITRLTLDSLRSAMSVVPQDVFLFHRTVHGEYPLRQTGSDRQRSARGGRGSRLPRLHPGHAGGVRHGGRRSRRQAVRRPAPAPRNCPRLPARRPDPGAGRGDLRARLGVRAGGAGGAGPPDDRPHGDLGRAPAVDAARLRPHRCHAGRPYRAGRRPRRTGTPRRPLPRTAGPPGPPPGRPRRLTRLSSAY